jgi:hypothetical protein
MNLQASSEKVLPLIGTAIELAPGLLPFAAIALQTKPTVFFGKYSYFDINSYTYIHKYVNNMYIYPLPLVAIALQTKPTVFFGTCI